LPPNLLLNFAHPSLLGTIIALRCMFRGSLPRLHDRAEYLREKKHQENDDPEAL
jgi:hypothetical protein